MVPAMRVLALVGCWDSQVLVYLDCSGKLELKKKDCRLSLEQAVVDRFRSRTPFSCSTVNRLFHLVSTGPLYWMGVMLYCGPPLTRGKAILLFQELSSLLATVCKSSLMLSREVTWVLWVRAAGLCRKICKRTQQCMAPCWTPVSLERPRMRYSARLMRSSCRERCFN